VTFEEQDGKTRMTVVQSGFPTAELRDYFPTTAWAGALDALHAYLTKEKLP
jgi:Activator of Hsp90 ATPase homolog 1-like protein